MGPLVRVTYSSLTQRVFRLDRVKSTVLVILQKRSLWIFALMPGALVAAHPKLWSFVRICAWSMLLLGLKPPVAHYPEFMICLETIFSKKLFHKRKKYLIWILRACTCPGFKNQVVIPQEAFQALGMCFHVGLQRFTPPLCNYSRSPSTWDLQFSSASQMGASTRKWGSRFRLGEVEPSFNEFLLLPHGCVSKF
jgi:hypothetical protein